MLHRLVLLIAPIALIACGGAAHAAEPVGDSVPSGLWELAATHKAPFDMRLIEPLGKVLVVSDLTGQVAAMRPDSGLIAWSRKVPSEASLGRAMSGVWSLATDEGGIVIAAGDSITAFRADVGSRLWERDLGCQSNGCHTRVVHASVPAGSKDPLLFLATGGVVQSELVRLDAATGAPLWRRAATVQHPKRVIATKSLLITEDSIEPYTIRFFDPADGRVIGAWQPSIGGATKPVSELLHLADGRTIAIDLRPDSGLASVTVLSATGSEITERQVPRPAQVTNLATVAARVDDGLAIFTPDPSNSAAYVTTFLLDAPWTARTEKITTWAAPMLIGGKWTFAPSVRAAGAGWSSTGNGRWAREVTGIDTSPQRTRTFAVGAKLALIDLGDSRTKTQAIVTLEGVSGRLHGIGIPELGDGTIDRALAVGEEIILTRGKTLFRMVLVPWASAIEKLRAARAQGTDIQSYLQRHLRFGPAGKALSDAVRLGDKRDPPPDSKTGPKTGPESGPTVAQGDGKLTPEDAALIKALRDAWLASSPNEALKGMVALVEQAPERSARRQALLNAFSTLLLDLVLAPGVVPRGDDVVVSLTSLARSFDWEAQASPPSRATVSIFGALMALVDEPLAGADLVAPHIGSDGLLTEARLELARRALFLSRKSAGALRTDTSRQMLVSALRLLKHFEALVGSQFAALSASFDRVVSGDLDATRVLESALIEAEGPFASRKGAGPAMCQLACEATASVCGGGAVDACQSRCVKTGAVRLSAQTRPTPDPQWYCH